MTQSVQKPTQVPIPVKFFNTFIQASSKWLAKTNDAKKGLELRIAQVAPTRLEFSVGGDSHFVQMIVETEAFDLPAPVFLDLSYFQNLALDKIESLILVQPREPNARLEEKRAQFKSPGMNFRIPVRSGEMWKRNHLDFTSVVLSDHQKLLLANTDAARIFPLLELPDSFGTKSVGLLKLAVASQSGALRAWTADSFAAFRHEFQNVVAPFAGDRALQLPYGFLQPYRAVSWDHKVLMLASTDRLIVGEVLPYREGPVSFLWLAPQQQGVVPDIEKSLEKERQNVQHSIDFDTGSFCQNLDRATAFYQDKDFLEKPLELSMIGKQYHLVGRLPQSEIVTEGESLTPPETNLKVMVQPRCLLDYTKRFRVQKPMRLEVARQTALLVQATDTERLQYWLPIAER